MPTTLLVDSTIPMVVVAEWARTTVLGAVAMESSKAMVALDCIRLSTWGRGKHRSAADASKVFVGGRQIILGVGARYDIVIDRLAMGLFVFVAVPRQVLEPLLVEFDLGVQLVEYRKDEHPEMFLRIGLPLTDRLEDVFLFTMVSVPEDVIASGFKVHGNLSSPLKILD